MCVYLIHFDEKYHHAAHYIGFCEEGNVEARLERHKSGNGARLLQVLNEKGIDYKIVRVWEHGDRNFERKLKNHKKSSRHCPICNPNKKGELYESG